MQELKVLSANPRWVWPSNGSSINSDANSAGLVVLLLHLVTHMADDGPLLGQYWLHIGRGTSWREKVGALSRIISCTCSWWYSARAETQKAAMQT